MRRKIKAYKSKNPKPVRLLGILYALGLWVMLALAALMPSVASDHGSGHSESEGSKSKKSSANFYSSTGMEQCKHPEAPEVKERICGSKVYEEYKQATEAYNECIKPYESMQLMPVHSCTGEAKTEAVKKQEQAQKNVSRLLDVP